MKGIRSEFQGYKEMIKDGGSFNNVAMTTFSGAIVFGHVKGGQAMSNTKGVKNRFKGGKFPATISI